MDFLNLILGILLIPTGIYLIDLTAKINRKHGPGYYLKLGTAGIGILIIAIFLIADELIKVI